LENGNLKTKLQNPVSTEWIALIWSINYVVTTTKVFTYTPFTAHASQ